MSTSKKNVFSRVIGRIKNPFYRNLLALAIPFALQNLIAFAMGFTDNLMVGQLGDNAISGIYMGNQPQTLLQMVIAGIEGAILILAAQYWGKGDTASIKKVVSIGIKFAAALGLIASLIALSIPQVILSLFTRESGVIAEGTEYLRFVGASYLFFSITQILIATMRSVENAKVGLYISLIGYALDCFLNYIMIFGKLGLPAMGVRGAAASIVGSLHSLIYVWMNALSSAIGILTGKMIGAEASLQEIKDYARRVQIMFLFVGLFSGIFTFFISDSFISLYNITPEAHGFAKQFSNIISITLIGTCYQAASLFGLVKSGGDISFVFKMDTFFVFGVVLPISFLALYLGAPPWVVFACLKIDQILKCFVALVKINRFNWMKNLTRITNEKDQTQENISTGENTLT